MLQITLGLTADSLKEQLGEIDTTPEQDAEIERLDMDADAISRLCVRGMIPESHAEKARQKLIRKIALLLK